MTLHTPTPESACICPRCQAVNLSVAKHQEMMAAWWREQDNQRISAEVEAARRRHHSIWRRIRSWLAGRTKA